MIMIPKALLAAIGTTLAAVAVFIGGFSGSIEVKPAETVFGGASSPNIVNNCMELGAGGPTLCTYRQPMVAASTTCAIKPDVASSTLIRAVARVNNAAGGTFDLEFGKGAINATTTSLGRVTGITGGITVNASTSQAVTMTNSAYNFTTGEYLNVKIGTTTVSSFVSGMCTAMFLSI